MGYSGSNQNNHSAEIDHAIAKMKSLLEDIFNHQEKCYQAFLSNPKDIDKKLFIAHEIYVRDLQKLLVEYQKLHDKVYSQVRFLHTPVSSLENEFFNTFGLCNEVLLDLTITTDRFPSFNQPQP